MTRHTWGAPMRNDYRTERTCLACGLVKITRHEGRLPWTEYRSEERGTFRADKVPPCDEALLRNQHGR